MTCAKETRDLVVECCVGESLPAVTTFSLTDIRDSGRIHTLDIFWSEWVMWSRVEEDHRPWTHYWSLKGAYMGYKCIIIFLPAPQRLGFETMLDEVQSVLKDHKQQVKVRVCAVKATFASQLSARRNGRRKYPNSMHLVLHKNNYLKSRRSCSLPVARSSRLRNPNHSSSKHHFQTHCINSGYLIYVRLVIFIVCHVLSYGPHFWRMTSSESL